MISVHRYTGLTKNRIYSQRGTLIESSPLSGASARWYRSRRSKLREYTKLLPHR
jgi:hypothetical protein